MAIFLVYIECRAVSMGQGQEVHARRLIQQSMASVNNTHLFTTCQDHLMHYFSILTGWMGSSPKLPSWIKLYG